MFSVVIPLYNKELSIDKTIQSVLSQTCQDFEVVVVNDGSTDSSAKVVEGIQDDRIRLINQENQGVSAARNHGIQEAKYEWIAFLDGDDLWTENHLNEIKKMMSIFPNENIYVTSFVFSDNRKVFKYPREEPIYKIKNYFKEVIKEHLIWTSILVVNKKSFDKVGGFNVMLSRGEDLELWSRLARVYNIIKSTSVTGIYRIEAENRSYLNEEIEKSCIYHFNFNLDLIPDERKYYMFLVLNKLYDYMRTLSFSNFIKLKVKYPEIKWNKFFFFSFSKVLNKLSKSK